MFYLFLNLHSYKYRFRFIIKFTKYTKLKIHYESYRKDNISCFILLKFRFSFSDSNLENTTLLKSCVFGT